MKAIQPTPLALAALLCCHVLAHATQPSGAKVVNGSATVNSFGNGMQVTNSPGAIIQWDGFSIGAGQTVRFDQLTANSAVLNRVTGNRASEIFGTLQSNGRVFLINPNGLLFGKGSKVDTAGFVASALDISNDDFLSGNYRFKCANSVACEAGVDVLNPINGRIVLQDGSEITTRQAGNGGQVWLIARDRITSEKGSKIDTPGGQVIAATAREVSVTSPSLGQMRFTLTGTTNTRIDLAGDIDVARGAAGFFADTIRLAGKVSALSEKGAAGQIVAQAATDILIEDDARLNVSGIDGADAGAIRLAAGRKIVVAASVDVAADGGVPTAESEGGKGGLIALAAPEIVINSLLPTSVDYNGRVTGLGRTYPRTVLHARAFDAANNHDIAKFGVVDVTETGTFAYASVAWDLSWQSSFTINTGSVDQSMVPMLSGDGRYLLLRVNEKRGAFSSSVQAYVVSESGAVVAANMLAEGGRDYSVAATGLTKGGWFVAGGANSISMSSGFIVSPNGDVITLALPTSGTDGSNVVLEATPLLGGGVLVDIGPRFGPVETRVAFTAKGERVSDLTSYLKNENLTQGSLPSQLAYGNYRVNDERLMLDSQTGGDGPALINSLTGDRVVELGPVPRNEATYAINGDVAITADPANFSPAMSMWVKKAPISLDAVSEVDSDRRRVFSLPGGDFVRTADGVTSLEPNKPFDPLVVQTQKISFVDRSLTSAPTVSADVAGILLTPALLGIAPGQRNGVVVPPSDTETGAGAGSGGAGSGSSGSGNASSTPPLSPGPSGPIGLSLPPPPAPITPPKSPNASTKPGSGVEASIITNPSADGGRQELLDAAADVVEHELGKAMADKFREAKTPEERGIILQEAADAEVLGRELYDIVKDMDPEMSDALFEGWSVLQQAGLEQEPGVSEGLLNALTIKRDGGTNEDGSPGVARTALEVPLGILRAEMHQAKTPEEKARVRNLMTRELLLAAREEAGKEADDTADVVLTDVAGKKTRITPKGDLIRE